MRLSRKCSLALVIMLLASCQPTNVLMTATNVQPSTSTRTPNGLQIPTFTSLGGFTPTASIQPPPENILKYECLDLTTDLQDNVKLTGRLILWGRQSYFFDFERRTFQIIPGKRGDFAVSPDGEWLAYYEISEASPTGLWLTVESADGQQKRLPMHQDWYWGVGIRWLDNQRFVYNVWDGNAITPIYPVVVIDPFTGAIQVLASDYPNLVPKVLGMAGTPHFVYSTVVYDSSLDLVVYPETNSEGDFVVLWDRYSQVALAKLHDLNNFGHTPLWLPDKSEFVIAVRNTWENDEWFAISRDGRIRQLTHFGRSLTKSYIESASISPDGRYLSFWLKVEPSAPSGYNLAILNLDTQQVTDYCVPGSIGATGEPVWSPDSQYFVVSSDNGPNENQVILIAPFKGWAVRIADDFTPRGWMITSP